MKTLQFIYKLFTVFCAIILFGSSFLLQAQTRAQLDSLRSEASVITYNNPELAIEKGLELYKLAKKDPSTQIGAFELTQLQKTVKTLQIEYVFSVLLAGNTSG
jgi:hypothetical protein